MEDQQPDPGDLTTEDASAVEQPRRRLFRRRPKSTVTEEPVVPEVVKKTPTGKAARSAKVRATEPEPAEVPAAEAEEPVAEADEPVVLVPHRPVGRKMIAAAAVAATVFVGAGAFAASSSQPYLSERAAVATKLEVARFATDAISTLWTYTPEDMATLADRASRYLGGNFADEYRRYIDAIVEPNKQAQVTNTTQVMGAAIESVSPPTTPTEATALVYTNSVATSPVTKNIPALRYLSYRLTMQREGGDWRITRMSTITSFDLTPQL